MSTTKDLSKYGLKNVRAQWNLDAETLQKLTVENNMGVETDNGTLCVNTGKFTGRSPKDRFFGEGRIHQGQSLVGQNKQTSISRKF